MMWNVKIWNTSLMMMLLAVCCIYKNSQDLILFLWLECWEDIKTTLACMDQWKGVKKVLRYVQGTKEYMLTYRKSSQLKVIGYSDLDFVGCIDSTKSTFGYIFLLDNGEYHEKLWKSLVITASTMEVEFVVCFEATVHALWLWNFISGIEVVDTSVIRTGLVRPV